MTISRDNIVNWIQNCAAVLEDNKYYLTQLDSDIGDGDHGENICLGFRTVLDRLPDVTDKDIGTIFKSVGLTLSSTTGGASGPLYGAFFMQMGVATANKYRLTLIEWASAVQAGLDGVITNGKAAPGDKTMVDVLVPSSEALKSAVIEEMPIRDALWKCLRAAEKGVRDTIPMVAKKGRAGNLGERSAGYQDPGATSLMLLFRVAVNTWINGLRRV